MNIKDAIYNRRSIRQYQKGFQIPESDLHQILDCAMYAPSAMNKQPWEFFVATDTHIISQIQSIHPYASFLSDAGTGIIVCVNLEQEYTNMGIIDVSLASQNIMLMAHALGYGTCYCGIYPDRSKNFQETLHLPNHIEPIGLIVIGKPLEPLATTKPVKNRFNSNAVHFNQW